MKGIDCIQQSYCHIWQKKFITDDKEYQEVSNMIENSAIDFKGILGRRDRIVYEEGIEKGKVINNHEIAIDLIKYGYDDTEIKKNNKTKTIRNKQTKTRKLNLIDKKKNKTLLFNKIE